IVAGLRARFPTPGLSLGRRISRRSLTVLLHLLQPLARLVGRVRGGLTVWRQRDSAAVTWPPRRPHGFWVRSGRPQEIWLQELVQALRDRKARVVSGGPFDRWDIEVRSGALGAARLLMAVEEHERGSQLVRVRCWPRLLARSVTIIGALGAV